MMLITRRAFLAAVAAFGNPRLRCAPPAEDGAQARRYRVDATIMLWSVPLFCRAGVGGGFAAHIETGRSTVTTHWIDFAAGSLPQRAHGLYRLGYIHERIVEVSGKIVETECLGFMTASNEDSLEQGRAALQNRSQTEPAFVAIEARCDGARVRTAVARFEARTAEGWSQCSSLVPLARTACARDAGVIRNERAFDGGSQSTFLLAVIRAMRASASRQSQLYVYSGDVFRLTTEKRFDPAMGRRLVEKLLAGAPERIWRVDGKTRNLRTGQESEFRLWVEAGSVCALPLRIEYRPKRYLQLVFEAERPYSERASAGLP